MTELRKFQLQHKEKAMKKVLAGVTLGVAATLMSIVLLAGYASAVAPAYTDVPWTNDMNVASYWNSYFATPNRTVSCTKYEPHNGYIPAEYDAAVTKKGSTVVRVYSDLTSTGAFQATHPQGEPPMSWVMKCKFTPVVTTTTSTTTTTTTTTVPEETTTTTTVPDDSTTTTVTVPEDSTTTTSTTTPPHVETTTTLPPHIETTVPPTLPPTGASSETPVIAWSALAALVLGAGAVVAARRRTTS